MAHKTIALKGALEEVQIFKLTKQTEVQEEIDKVQRAVKEMQVTLHLISHLLVNQDLEVQTLTIQ